MSKTIAINGVRLDEVRMAIEPYSKDVVSSLVCPTSEIHLVQDEGGITPGRSVLSRFRALPGRHLTPGREYPCGDFDQRPRRQAGTL